MPGTLHQGILLLFQEDPWLAFDVLGLPRTVEGHPIDRRAEVEREGLENLTVRQGYPDLVLVHRDLRDPERGIVITVEAQKKLDLDKRWLIPVYQSHLAENHRLGTWVVVVSLDAAMSRAIRSWSSGEPPRIDVLLLDVQSVSQRWIDEAAQRPTAAVLAGTLHGYAGDLEATRRAFHAVRSLPGRNNRRHALTLLSALSEQHRNQLIGEIPMQEEHDWVDVERRSGTYKFGHKEGEEEGLRKGLAKGRKEGRREGVEEGRRKALLELLFDLLAERDMRITARQKARIRACSDPRTLRAWARRAVHVDSVDELLESA